MFQDPCGPHWADEGAETAEGGEDAYLSHTANKGQSRDLNPELWDS